MKFFLLFRYDEKEIDYERLLNRMNYAANPCLPIPPRHVPVSKCTEMQENMWATLRESSMHLGASHAT